jgi:O-antigen ligase
MRKLMLGAGLASYLALIGCTTQQIQQLDALTSQFIADVQAGAAAACKVIPTVAAITAIFNC